MRTAAGSNWTHCAHTGDSGPGTRRYWRVITSKRKQRQRKNKKSNENKLKMRALDMHTNIAPEFAGVLIGIRVPLFLDYGRDDRYYGGGDDNRSAILSGHAIRTELDTNNEIPEGSRRTRTFTYGQNKAFF